MPNENDLVEMTIRVDLSGGVTLVHVCAKCGKTEKSTPACFESFDRNAGTVNAEGIFTIRSASPPRGWEHMRITPDSPHEGTKHVEVCPECVRAFFRFVEPKNLDRAKQLIADLVYSTKMGTSTWDQELDVILKALL